MEELILRVRALLRRANIANEKKLSIGALTMNADEMTACLDGREIPLTVKEFNVLFRAEELESIETLKSDFISNVSHKIKTPLSVIQGYAMALQNDALPAGERKEYTATIVEASRKLSDLVSNILKLNKLENQEIIPESRPYDLSEQLRRCAVTFEEIWEHKNISFDADLDETSVCYNEDMLEMVWNNLLSNAIKFTGAGGRISLTLKARDGFAKGMYVQVTVQDSGCGMDEETKKHIFDKFYQVDTSHSREGNGLGLALAKKVIEMQGASIAVESAPGRGSTFTVYLKISPNSHIFYDLTNP
jgi:signal transduction histidine kinase